MALTLSSLQVRDFRNYEYLSLENIQPISIFVGPNAIGKTNIVEAIQMITSLESFRNQPLEYMIREGCANGLIKGSFIDKDQGRHLEIALEIEKGHRRYLLNDKQKKPVDLQGVIPSVVFTPDDLEIIKGAQQKRRQELDSLGCQLSKNHRILKHDFELILRQKNALLKDENQRGFIDSIDDVFVTCSATFTCYRIALIQKLRPYFIKHYNRLCSNGEQVDIEYIPSWINENKQGECNTVCNELYEISVNEMKEILYKMLKEKREEELIRHRALIGAHIDRIVFSINKRNASLFASQGQQRSLILAWKLAEVDLIEEMLQVKPLILLDDVMSELDESRRNSLVLLLQTAAQVFITTANLQYFENSVLKEVKPYFLPLNETASEVR